MHANSLLASNQTQLFSKQAREENTSLISEEIGVEGELKDGNVYISEPGGVSKGLAAIWKVVFGYKATNPAAAKRLLRDYNPGWNWSLAKNPTPEMVSDVMEVRKNCMPGLDGTPKAAWKFGGQHTLNYNMRLTDAFFLNEPEEIEVFSGPNGIEPSFRKLGSIGSGPWTV